VIEKVAPYAHETQKANSALWAHFRHLEEPMSGLSRETRLQIMLDDAELAAIDDYRFKNRMPSRAAAVRELLRLGMQAAGGESIRGKRSTDYGVIKNRGGPED
jgi:hypothetical protein